MKMKYIMNWLLFLMVWMNFAKLYMDFDINAKIITGVFLIYILYDLFVSKHED